MKFQTRNGDGTLRFFTSMSNAIKASEEDKTIWKISFTINESDERIRLVRRNGNEWHYEPIM